eukprot:scaffold139450_cov142-Phaeocystis_antarctica.AAC.1
MKHSTLLSTESPPTNARDRRGAWSTRSVGCEDARGGGCWMCWWRTCGMSSRCSRPTSLALTYPSAQVHHRDPLSSPRSALIKICANKKIGFWEKKRPLCGSYPVPSGANVSPKAGAILVAREYQSVRLSY